MMVSKKKILRGIFKFLLLAGISSEIFSQSLEKTDKPIPEKGREYQEKMVFQEIQNSYLIFFNAQKKIFYLQYRRDQWDYDNNEVIRKLIEGNLYNVWFTYTEDVETMDDLITKENKSVVDAKSPKSKSIRKRETIRKGIYKKHNSAEIETLRGFGKGI